VDEVGDDPNLDLDAGDDALGDRALLAGRDVGAARGL
jgi:hypothetical protein